MSLRSLPIRVPTRLASLALICLYPFVQAAPPTNSAQLQWSPIVEFDNQLFPATILALATKHVNNLPPTYLGDPNGALGVAITSLTPGARVRVSVKVDRLADESTLETVLADANRQYEIFPPIRFDTRALAKIREAFPTTAVFSVSAGGVSIGEQTRPIQVRAVNDIPFEYRARNGKLRDFSSLFAAFVDENHPWIDGVLSEALRCGAVQQFIGYQGKPNDVVRQIFAIWNVLQRHEVKYSSITRPSGESQTVMSQHVRFLDESIRYSQANCVDGTVLFASILYKIGLSPVLVIKPGHMFLGIHVTSPSPGQKPNWIFLETTLIGNPGINTQQRHWRFLTAEGYKSSESYRQFMNAVNVGDQEFKSIVRSLNSHEPGFRVIDVAGARKAGIAAIPRS
jgi:hypothetical protein